MVYDQDKPKVKGQVNYTFVDLIDKYRFILSEKIWFHMKTIHQLSISNVKMLLLTRNIEKYIKFVNFFGLHDQ